MSHINTLNIVRSQRSALIREEVRASTQRGRLEQAVRQAIRYQGCDINEVSEASGLSPREIRRILDCPPELDAGIKHLAGVA